MLDLSFGECLVVLSRFSSLIYQRNRSWIFCWSSQSDFWYKIGNGRSSSTKKTYFNIWWEVGYLHDSTQQKQLRIVCMYTMYIFYVEYCTFDSHCELTKHVTFANVVFFILQMANKILLSIFCISLVASVHSFVFSVEATKEECFYEVLAVNSPIGIMFQVVQGGFLDIDIEVIYLFSRKFL